MGPGVGGGVPLTPVLGRQRQAGAPPSTNKTEETSKNSHPLNVLLALSFCFGLFETWFLCVIALAALRLQEICLPIPPACED